MYESIPIETGKDQRSQIRPETEMESKGYQDHFGGPVLWSWVRVMLLQFEIKWIQNALLRPIQ
jgi:hypothetical protein